MKFLVVKRIDLKGNPVAARSQSQQLQQLAKKNPQEDIWLLRDGGHAFLVPADEAGQPLMGPGDDSPEAAGQVEVFPVTNAFELLEQVARGGKSETEACN